ncbi:CO dehydrogenase/acetyl-CoA synthase complex subunit epsilon [Candidatus Bathyarchaeota archaeon]|nr:MAG: CO dehydrogenase/acetyl-CoA synthase complex subunit epsilon [Candidatus Bathyarchaeota archaeon]TEU06662.1 MAG: CO dehydrogenase/acetyl-CoA synthase complex subunit epsilon [Candidatus Bathyarchaeota archaeon]
MELVKKGLLVKVKELKTDVAVVKDLEVSIGRIVDKTWTEPVGPTPFPSMTDLREWDFKLLQRYKPFYLPFCDVCCLCTFGKCDLTGDKRGACGLNMASQQSRMVLLACCIGAATHISHARHLVEHLIEKYGRNSPLDVGGLSIDIEAPVTRLVCGVRPKTLKDLGDILDYCEGQVTTLLAATHTGQEGSNLDFESKVLHAGMVDQVGMEIADLAQISVYGFPKAEPEAALTDLGFGVADISKPTILVIGHNVPSSIGIIDYLTDKGLLGKVEVVGICCTAHDITRYSSMAKIVGPISWQLRYIRSGLADLIVVDEQCIRADALVEAKKVKTPVIASSPQNCLGLKNRTESPSEAVISDLVEGKVPGVLILDPDKVGEVAVETVRAVAPKRNKFNVIPEIKEIIKAAQGCTQCDECRRACPNDQPIPEAMKAAAKGDLNPLAEILENCVGCARCDSACPNDFPLHSFLVKAGEKQLWKEKFKMRVGRGAIQDVEIREVGGPIVLGEIPGVVAIVGCANYPRGGKEVAEIAEEFAKRRFIVVTSGCAAMSIAMVKDEEGKTLYEKYSGAFEAGGIVNVGSCVANSHIAGAAIKIASIFAKRRLRANYEEIADYIYNRLGAVGVAWGAYSQKAASIASGFWRLGVPVIVGPHGSKYRRMLLGRKDKEEDWYVYNARTGDKVYGGPAPEHLFTTAETKEEAMVMIAKLCMRPNDTTKGRAIKLTHYIDLHRRLYGVMPDDIHLFVRNKADVPITMKDEILKVLEEEGWKERLIPDPTLLPRLIRKRKGD